MSERPQEQETRLVKCVECSSPNLYARCGDCGLTQPFPVAQPAPEACICAAILTSKGIVIRGHRHHDCMRTAAAMDLALWTLDRESAQGFITSKGRYVNRREGRRLQEAAGIESAAPGGYRGDILFSEDLY